MGLAPPRLNQVPGLTFFKLMGSGQGKVFSLQPDWCRYTLLATWKNPEDARSFFENASAMRSFREKANEIWTVYLYPIQSQGLWSGSNPFQPITAPVLPDTPVGILTRASIRPRALRQFWKYAPQSAKGLETANGLLFSIGVGELPFIRQATLSIWKNLAAMKAFAYGTQEHKEAMKQKVRQNWYSEELFARFVPVGSTGTVEGSDPLQNQILSSLPANPLSQ
jgi:hypothetical protein